MSKTLNVEKLWNMSKFEWSLYLGAQNTRGALKMLENKGFSEHSIICLNRTKLAEKH